MSCLLDTAVFLWMISGQEENVSKKASSILEEEELVLSAVALWEIAIKHALGKLELKGNPRSWLPEIVVKMQLRPLPITHRHAWGILDLPPHHKDPFDRLLISQARIEKLPILSPDAVFKKYRVETIW